ncbi:MAG: hypothetical protein Q3993_06250 [Filifactor alocis]|nr:hypothetical protein [Filifactor alocis]
MESRKQGSVFCSNFCKTIYEKKLGLDIAVRDGRGLRGVEWGSIDLREHRGIWEL